MCSAVAGVQRWPTCSDTLRALTGTESVRTVGFVCSSWATLCHCVGSRGDGPTVWPRVAGGVCGVCVSALESRPRLVVLLGFHPLNGAAGPFCQCLGFLCLCSLWNSFLGCSTEKRKELGKQFGKSLVNHLCNVLPV